jgi:hypothetical protein
MFNAVTSVATCSVAGKYLFNYSVGIDQFLSSSSHTSCNVYFAVTGKSSSANYVGPGIATSTGGLILTGAYIVDLDVGDTVSIRLNVGGGTKTVDVNSGRDTKFEGYLL